MVLGRYMHWLHTRWPAGTVEKMPDAGEDGETAVPGVRVVGDLTGIPLLKFSAHTGARAVRAIAAEPGFAQRKPSDQVVDLAIVGAGVSGMSAALEAKAQGLSYVLFEAAQPFNTIWNFPKQKPIYTYPTEMKPDGQLTVSADVKEALYDELTEQQKKAGVELTQAHVEQIERKGSELVVRTKEGETRAHRVILAIGRSGNYRKLGVPGQDRDKVFHRLYDPMEHTGKKVLVVGGGDSAVETAVALTLAGADVTFSYRKKELSRPKPENVEKLHELASNPAADVCVECPTSDRVNAAADATMREGKPAGKLTLKLGSKLKEVTESAAVLEENGQDVQLPNDVVFAMIGREAPLDFFRRSGIPIRGEWSARTWASFLAFVAFCFFIYNWKAGGTINQAFREAGWFPYNMPAAIKAWAAAAADPANLIGTLAISLEEPGFYYSLAYCAAVIVFGFRRIKRRQTPYVKTQTLTLMAVQTVPLFLLPYVVLPYIGHGGVFDTGTGKIIADELFPVAGYGHGREYWRAFGFILAWPLFIWNFFTNEPMKWWLIIGSLQTFVIIPLIIRRWGKGAYCGWICSCGALAETLGDTHRHKMPHGPLWNRLNMIGQAVLLFATVLFGARIYSWTFPNTGLGRSMATLFQKGLSDFTVFGVSLDYYHFVDMFLAGIVGVGFYFWFSGRVWCRFACPLAALMHIYARFTKFRIFADKKKCISCNVCTSVCHQGIDIMNFANKGRPMEDPECVRCSACVQSCPTGVLNFGHFGPDGTPVFDTLPASPVQMRELEERDGKKRLTQAAA